MSKGKFRKYKGRPSMYEKEPGSPSCFKQLKGPRPRICRQCQVLDIQPEKKKRFGF